MDDPHITLNPNQVLHSCHVTVEGFINEIFGRSNARALIPQQIKDLIIVMYARFTKISLQCPFVIFKVGDTVELDTGQMGTIKYVGNTKMNQTEDVIGIELDEFDNQAHDGRGYFRTKKV